jgi:hypothetical protein
MQNSRFFLRIQKHDFYLTGSSNGLLAFRRWPGGVIRLPSGFRASSRWFTASEKMLRTTLSFEPERFRMGIPDERAGVLSLRGAIHR